MGTSYIDYRNNGFWTSDSTIGIATKYVIEIIESKYSNIVWLKQYVDEDLIQVALGYMIGCSSLSFNEVLDSNEKLNILISVISDTIDYLSLDTLIITKDEINNYRYQGNKSAYGTFNNDINKQLIIDFLNECINLLNGNNLRKWVGIENYSIL